jgi:hypothetical protein
MKRANVNSKERILNMALSEEEIIDIAREDLIDRLGVDKSDVEEVSITKTDFPNTALGALEEDEMSADMITSGWRVIFDVGGEEYEYRADQEQIRLVNFGGSNFLIYE